MKTKEEVLKGDSYLVDCFIESRNGENIFTNLKNGHVIARLENYAIIPMEKYLKIAPVEQSEQAECEHCKSKNITIGDGGLWCDDCGRLTKHNTKK